MRERVKQWGDRFNQVVAERILNRTDHKQQLDADFDKAKRASDFVSMLVNAAFLAFCNKYFWAKANQTSGLDSVCLMATGSAALMGYIYIVFRTNMVALNFFLGDLKYRKTKLGKLQVVAFSFIPVTMYYYSLTFLIHDLSSSNSVLKGVLSLPNPTGQ